MLSRDRDKSRIRPPAVAGLFYPANANELRRVVESCLDAATPRASTPTPKALIVPHAGYVYSGPVAGFAYRALRDAPATVRHVVMIGPSHRVPLDGLAVPSATAFATPLGDVAVDVATRDRLCVLGLVSTSDAAHAFEHSLETQLPFLQVALAAQAFDILPIVYGYASAAQTARVLEAAWGDPDTLILVSSDLSHYHAWDDARRIDEATTHAILERRDDLDDEQACGARGINGLMRVARERVLRVELLDRRNSGDTAGDRSRVVGYASLAVYDA
jgi:AmmeMemoRadiSam system protein B